MQTTDEIRSFMLAQLEHFKEEGIDPDAISLEELSSASLTFRKQYETEIRKNTDPAQSITSQ